MIIIIVTNDKGKGVASLEKEKTKKITIEEFPLMRHLVNLIFSKYSFIDHVYIKKYNSFVKKNPDTALFLVL